MASSSSAQISNRPSLLDLPLENHLQIVEHVPTKRLFTLQLVSKRLHELASSRIYRSLTFFLSHPDAAQFYREPQYRLADALQTFATSGYDYAQHVKKFKVCMSETETEDANKRIASRYHLSEEPTMLLNMALLIMAKKARTMESFSWNVPIELSPDLYDALSKSQSLQCLHIRLDSMSIMRPRTVPYGSMPLPPEIAQQILHGHQPPPIHGSISYALPFGGAPPKAVGTLGKSKLARMRNEQRKFGKFRGLRDLRIIAIENLDCLEEIQSCLARSSGTLRALTLSLSPSLVQKARKRPSTAAPPGPAANNVGAGVDDDDEALTEPETPPPANLQTNAGPSDADIKKERQAQERTLARIFGCAQPDAKDKKLDKSLKESAKSVKLKDKDTDSSLSKAQQHLQKILKSPTLNQADKLHMQKILKEISRQLSQEASTPAKQSSKNKKKTEVKAVDKNPGKALAKKAKYSGGPWTSAPPFHYTDLDDWTSIPPLPPVGSGSQSSTTKPTYMYPSQGGAKNGVFPPSADTLKALFGPHASVAAMEDALEDYQYMPSSSSQIANHPLGTHAKPPSASFSYGTSKYPPPQPPQFNTNAYSNTHSGSVSPFPYSYEDALNDPVLTDAQSIISQIKKSLQDTNNHLVPPSMAYSYQDFANTPGQNHGKPVGKNSTPEDLVVVESDSDSSSSNEDLIKFDKAPESSPTKQSGNAQSTEDTGDMDVDMEHPDVEGQSDGESVECRESPLSIAEDTKGSSKENGFLLEPSELTLKENVPLQIQTSGTDNSLMSRSKGKLVQGDILDGTHEVPKILLDDDPPQAKTKSPEDIMQEYIRSKHGFSLEEFSLYLVPLKPSVIAKAVDMRCLRRLSLYSVGPQGAFWTLFEKSTSSGFGSKLEVIRTDDVSNSFVYCVSKLNGLKELHLTRRTPKDFDATAKKAPAAIDEIRKLVLAKHLPTLQSLALANYEDDKWDLSGKCVRLMAAKGKGLKELTCSVDTSNFHVLMQSLPGMRCLEAIHFLTIRSHERIASLNKECRKFIVDVLHFCPELKLKYVAMANMVYQFSPKPKISLPNWLSKQEQALYSRSSKGKSKAVERFAATKSPLADDMDSEDLSDLDEARPNVFVAKHWKFNEVPEHYEIFTNEVRRAKL